MERADALSYHLTLTLPIKGREQRLLLRSGDRGVVRPLAFLLQSNPDMFPGGMTPLSQHTLTNLFVNRDADTVAPVLLR